MSECFDKVMCMKIYQTKHQPYTGTSYSEIERKARADYQAISKLSKRNTYLRSKYFNGEKVFLALFWEHLNQKPRRERKRRLRYYRCALDLLRNSQQEPVSKTNPNRHEEILHRFAGVAKSGDLFYVQIKENTRTGHKVKRRNSASVVYQLRAEFLNDISSAAARMPIIILTNTYVNNNTSHKNDTHPHPHHTCYPNPTQTRDERSHRATADDLREFTPYGVTVGKGSLHVPYNIPKPPFKRLLQLIIAHNTKRHKIKP